MRLIPVFLLVGALLGGLPALSGAQTTESAAETPATMLERWDAESSEIEQRLAEDPPETAEIDEMRRLLVTQHDAIPILVASAEATLRPLRQQLEALGEPPEDPAIEVPEIAEERARLVELIAAREAGLKRASQAAARATALHARLTELRRNLFTERMRTRGPSLLEPGMLGKAIAALGRTARTIEIETKARLEWQEIGSSQLPGLLVPILLALWAWLSLFAIRRNVLNRLLPLVEPDMPQARRAAISAAIILTRLLLPAASLMIVVLAIDQSDLLGPRGEMVLAGLARAVVLMIAAYALGGAFFAPRAPSLRLSRLDDQSAAHAHHWLIGLAAVVGLDRTVVTTGDQLGMAIEALSFLNSGLLVLGGFTLWRFVHFLRPRREQATAEENAGIEEITTGETYQPVLPVLHNGLIWLARLAGVAAPLLAIAGYFAASRYAFYPLVASGGVIGLCILLFHAVRESLWLVTDPGSVVRPEDRQFSLITFTVGFILAIAIVPVLALIWGADRTDVILARRVITDGFSLGDVVISPLGFLSFLVVFSLGYMLARIVQGVISRSVLPLTRLDTGGRAAVSTGVFYFGVVLSALAAIAVTGLDLSNLAIVAGALSVGIGFGLQNIVNNFVSGVILLIEQPIKEGDWIELTSGMGYVKKVNVRSTEIDTFDRATLFVPNSELISNTVTNWTHSNLNGRLIVPIGVAYGTDPKKVETILTEIAKAHPMLLRQPAPYVLFRRFGADSLDFEVRGVLRDVNWILNVASEINFEISRRFAEAGIEIPFAQRDLHLRNADELGRSIASALKGGAEEPQTETPITKKSALPRRPSGSTEAAGYEPDGDN